jgi:nicotinate-nucleotide pyrophosphorylase (carboxylating)
MTTSLPAALVTDLEAAVRRALGEDVGTGDRTAALVPAAQQATATVTAREAAILCGQPWVDEVFRQLGGGVRIHWGVAEGAEVAAGTVVCELAGPARTLLTGERTALNFLQTLSGTATAVRPYVRAVADLPTRILDTRKTVPGLRLAQKYAVRVAGGTNHRLGLYDGILVKENHIVAAGGITAAVRAARATPAGVLVQVEVENLAEAEEALRAGPDRLLLDDMPPEELRAAVALRDRLAPGIGLEASGNVTLANVAAIAATGVDFISVGSLTKHVRAIDLSMRFRFAAPA